MLAVVTAAAEAVTPRAQLVFMVAAQCEPVVSVAAEVSVARVVFVAADSIVGDSLVPDLLAREVSLVAVDSTAWPMLTVRALRAVASSAAEAASAAAAAQARVEVT
jgi:hypothetical protein